MLTRRAMLAASTAAVTMPAAPFAARAATPAGVAVMAKHIDDIVSFDPAEAYEFTNNEVDGNIYRRLVGPNHSDNTTVSGDLAEKWEISPDGREFTFHLVKDAFFPSGKALTAEDAAFSLQRVVKLNKTPGFILTQFGLTKDNVDRLIRATDEHTLQMSLPIAQAPTFVLFCLSANVGSIVEKATALANQQGDDLGNAWLKSHSAGSGPYALTQWVASDHVTIDANPHSGMPVICKRVSIRHIADPSAQLLMLQKGDADIVRDLTPDQIKSLKPADGTNITSAGQGSSVYVGMNMSLPQFKKPQVLQAMKWAIDYDAIARNITPNTYVVSQSILPKGLPGALTDTPFHKDVAKAKSLLAEAGYPDGFSVKMDTASVSPYVDIAQAVQADLAAIGVKVELITGEQKQVITKMRARTHEMALLYWGTDYFDPNSNAQAFCANPDDSDASKLRILAWRNHFSDPQLTKMVEDAAHELDGEKRIGMYVEIQKLARERSPFIILLQQISTAVLAKGVSGFVIGPLPDYTKYADIKKA